MLEKLVISDTGALSANEKLVLLVFVARFGRGWSGAVTLKYLAKQLALREGLVASAMPVLISRRYVKTSNGSGRPGRPLRAFAVVEEAVNYSKGALSTDKNILMESISSARSFLLAPTIRVSSLNWSDHSQSIDAGSGLHAIREGGVPVSSKVQRMIEGRKGFLDAPDVLLLALLLAASDPLGVVKGVSFRQIGAAIGVTPLAVKGRLKRLVRHRVLRQVIPGVAATIFQRKLESIILLNTNHPIFSKVGRGVAVAMSRQIEGETESELVRRLWLDSKAKNPLVYGSEVSLLRDIPSHAFEQLEFMLLEMASEGLEKVLSKGKIDRAELMDFASMGVGNVIRAHDDGSARYEMLLKLIDGLAFLVYLLVLELDQRIRPLLAELSVGGRVLMPPGNMWSGYGYVGVLVSPVFEPKEVAVEREFQAWCGVFQDEHEISLDARERAGLATSV